MTPVIRKNHSLRPVVAGLLTGASLTALALGAPSHAFNPQPAPLPASDASAPAAQASLADMVERVSPSVVQIFVRASSPVRRVVAPNEFSDLPPELRDFFGPDLRFYFGDRPNIPRQMPDRVGSGSGFFIDGGYIVTNNHVVDNARKLRVRFEDGEEVEGRLVGSDSKTDLAVIKVDPKHARKSLTWGDSDRTRAGDNVFTIGAPFSLGNTVTAGIISARGRDIGSGPYDDYLQIDAPINPGNSGGPMFNAAGEVIGVNTAIYSPSGGNVGIGFSIPAAQARAVVKQIIERGYVERGWLGVQVQRVTPDIADSLGLKEARGALVGEVTAGSPAAKAGLRSMDLILDYGGTPIDTIHALTRAVADTPPGTSREVKIRRDGRERTIAVRIEALESPSTSAAPSSSTPDKTALNGGLGLEVVEDAQGLLIADIAADSPAQEAGLRAGDRLLMVGDARVKSTQEAQAAVRAAKSKGRSAVLVQVERDGVKRFVAVSLA
jgi:serine protease Do